MKAALSALSRALYVASIACLQPANALLALLLRRRLWPDSVLHISYMVHIPFHTTRLLRRHGVRADYLAIGESRLWNQADYVKRASRIPFVQAWQDFVWLWTVLARYQVLHLHFMIPLSKTGWELHWLKRMGRRIVIHYRGCEIRNRERNMQLHPAVNICQRCDYNATICTDPVNLRRAALAREVGSDFLVTTPDMLDFAPHARHFPFFAPDCEALPPPARAGAPFTIVHVTNHPGIEGTEEIRAAVAAVAARGHDIRFEFLTDVSHDAVMHAYANADLAIGKMKMGYYANAQIESMALGVPTITWVRPEFMTPALRDSALIVSHLDDLAATIERCVTDPAFLAERRARARSSILALHDNDRLARDLIGLYGFRQTAV